MPDTGTSPVLAPPARQMMKRGVSREEAAIYVGVGVTLFDKLVAEGVYPQPRLQHGRITWDVWELDAAFSALPRRNGPAQNGPPRGWGDD